MVDLDHCSYATIWAGDKDCYRGNICYLSLACSFFLLLLSPPLEPRCRFLPLHPSLFNSSLLFSTSFHFYLNLSSLLLVVSSTFLNSALCPTTHPLLNPPLCVSSSPSIPPSLCVESGAAWLSLPPCWAGACLKGPRTLTHWGSPAMPEMPTLSSPHISAHLVPLHLHGIEEKVKLCLFRLSSLLFAIKVTHLSL